jgi:hypothetical protein
VSVGRAAQQLSTSVSGDNDPTYTQKKKGGDGGGRRRRGVGVRCGVDSNCSEGWGVEQRGVGHPAAALALSLSTFFTHRGNAATPAKESRRGNTARGWSWRSQQRRLEAHTHAKDNMSNPSRFRTPVARSSTPKWLTALHNEGLPTLSLCLLSHRPSTSASLPSGVSGHGTEHLFCPAPSRPSFSIFLMLFQ